MVLRVPLNIPFSVGPFCVSVKRNTCLTLVNTEKGRRVRKSEIIRKTTRFFFEF